MLCFLYFFRRQLLSDVVALSSDEEKCTSADTQYHRLCIILLCFKMTNSFEMVVSNSSTYCNDYSKNVYHFSSKKSKRNCWTSLLNMRICCFPALFIETNNKTLCFGLLFGQKKQFEDVTLGSGKLRGASFTFLTFYGINDGRLIDNENNRKLQLYLLRVQADAQQLTSLYSNLCVCSWKETTQSSLR